MVAGCPKCNARYRVAADRIGPEGAKLRCTKCSAVFLVRAPRAETAKPSEPVSAPAQPEASREAPRSEDPARLVLVADADEARGKAAAAAIEGGGLGCCLVHDGVQTMLAIQRRLPALVVVDAALPRMNGFEICEIVKRNESLRATPVVLVGAIDADAGQSGAGQEFDADVHLERPDLPDALTTILPRYGLPFEPPPASESPSPPSPPQRESPAPPSSSPQVDPSPPAPDSAAAASPSAECVAEVDPEIAAERERAERLARIAVSEMVLYQPEKFEQAAREGTLEQALDLEIGEARALLRQRISEEVRAERDFILEELRRVAAERSAAG